MFNEMRKHQLFSKHNKCFLIIVRIEYFGHFITTEGVSTDLQKIESVKNWPLPTTIKQLGGLLGLEGY